VYIIQRVSVGYGECVPQVAKRYSKWSIVKNFDFFLGILSGWKSNWSAIQDFGRLSTQGVRYFVRVEKIGPGRSPRH